MGLHVVAVAKLHLQLSGHSLRPVVAGFACPLVLKFLFGFRIFRDEALHQSRLFLFRFWHIAFNRDNPISNSGRMERALRLIWGTLSSGTATSSQEEESGIEEDTLHTLSMIAL